MTAGSRPLLGVVADDMTGAADAGAALARAGMTTIQVISVPERGTGVPPADAFVVALKSRTALVGHAVAHSLAALKWLQNMGATRFYFKYCSTFDSTPEGNIGPVAEALLGALDKELAVICPANPENGRTVYQSHLFVWDRLLSESSMRDHPLTPMRDHDLRRLLAAQVGRARVDSVMYAAVAKGPRRIRRELERLKALGVRYVVVDALSDDNLSSIARSATDDVLLSGAAGLVGALAAVYRESGLLAGPRAASPIDVPQGPGAILAGSCSTATLSQVATVRNSIPDCFLDPRLLAEDFEGTIATVVKRAVSQLGSVPVLIYSSVPPDEVAVVHDAIGPTAVGPLVEGAFSEIARRLLAAGVRRFVVAGGETAGAVVAGLGVRALRIGRTIEPGVPWTVTVDEPILGLALKSGNFGSPDFFQRAFRV